MGRDGLDSWPPFVLGQTSTPSSRTAEMSSGPIPQTDSSQSSTQRMASNLAPADDSGSKHEEAGVIPVAPQAKPSNRHRIHWKPMLGEEFFDIAVSHVDRIAHEPFTCAQLQGHVLEDWETIVENWEWSHWSDGDRASTTYLGHSSQGNVAGWIYRNNDDDGGIEQDFHDSAYRRILRNSFLVETAYAWQWKFGPLSEATIGHVGLTYDPSRNTNR